MEFFKINNDILKIRLDEAELGEIPVELEEMSHTDGATKRFLAGLLNRAEEETGFHPGNARLFVKLYPDRRGGCIVYFTILRGERPAGARSGLSPVLFVFDDARALCDGIVRFYRLYGHRVYKSSLYHYADKYTLIVWPLDYKDGLTVSYLYEYADKIGEGALRAAYVEEYGREIVRDCALETLAEYFA